MNDKYFGIGCHNAIAISDINYQFSTYTPHAQFI